MSKGFRCPACSVPLEIEDLYSSSEKCEFCGNNILLSSSGTQANEDSSGSDDLLAQARKLKEIKHLGVSGNKIEAIKIYREAFGTGLKESKDAVDNMVEGKRVDFKNISIFPTQNAPADNNNLKLAEIQNLLRQGNKIYAIKLYRETFDVGLKEAKEAVEQIERGSFTGETGFKQFNNQFNSQSTFGITKPAAERPVLNIVLGALAVILIILLIIYLFTNII